MAIYYLGVKSFGRSAGTGGSVATSAAAYRAGERIRDQRTNRIYDHSDRSDVQYKEILLPSHLQGAASGLDWARDRANLWNVVERTETRANARVAREYVLALPHEMNAEQRTVLARAFAQEISDRYYNAVDLAVHQPRSDPRNFHAHLLSTTREVTAAGFGPKTIAEMSGLQRFEQGLPRAAEEQARLRERWAVMTNEALREAGLAARVSHLPPGDAVLRPDARPWLPRVAWEIERRGEPSVLGDRAREQFARHRELARERNLQFGQPDRTGGVLASARRTAAEVRTQAIEEWRAIRAQLAGPATEASSWGSETERRIGDLRRELGRDDFAL